MCTELVELHATKTPLNLAIPEESYMRWLLISFHYEESSIAVPSGASTGSLLILKLIQPHMPHPAAMRCMRSFA